MRFKKPVYTLLSALFLNSVTLTIQAVQINENFNPIFNKGEFTVINDSVSDIFVFLSPIIMLYRLIRRVALCLIQLETSFYHPEGLG